MRAAQSWLLFISNDSANYDIIVCFGFKNKPTVIHFMSIRKSNEEIREKIVFDYEELIS